MNIYSLIIKQKNILKGNKKIIFKKPYLIFLLPIIFIQVFISRIIYDDTVVYLLQKNIKQHELPNSDIRIEKDITNIKKILEDRISEDESVSENYLDKSVLSVKKGDFMVFSMNEDNVTSFLFVSTDVARFIPVGINLKMPKYTCAIYDVYTFKSFRNMGFYKILFLKTENYLFRIGYRMIWLWLMKHNIPSIKSHLSLEFRQVIKELYRSNRYGLCFKKIENVDYPINDLLK